MERSRVAVVFDPFSGPPAADFTTFVESVAQALKKNSDVLSLRSRGAATVSRSGRPRSGLARGVRATLRAFQPHLVLYVPSPKSPLATLRSGFAVRRSAPEAHHVMTILAPMWQSRLPKSRFLKTVLPRLYPDPILVPSYRSLLALSRMSLVGDVLPLGVDVGAFRPSSRDERSTLREHHGIDPRAFVFLLGPPLDRESLEAARSLGAIEGVQIVASTENVAGALTSDAASIGVRLVSAANDATDIYRLSDCFVFSARDEMNAVEFPMSVIASLSCHVPVLARPFGGLRDFLSEGEDLRYWNSTDELAQLARDIRAKPPARVRAVEEFSWDAIAGRIMSHRQG